MKRVLYFLTWVLIALVCQAQNPNKGMEMPIPLGGQKLYTWEALNLNAQVSEDGYVILSSTRTRTKATDPCSSAVRQPVSYTNWWTDSTEHIANGTFNTNLNNWDTLATPTTIEWVANGGGFTGVAHIIGNSDQDGIISDFYQINTGRYRLSFDLNITTLTADGVYASIFAQSGQQTLQLEPYWEATGVFNYDTTFNFTGNAFLDINISQYGVGGTEFYIDNVSLVSFIEDSSQTMSKILTSLPEDIPFYWYSSLTYRTKGKNNVCVVDTFYHADEVDTFYTLPNSVNFQYVNGGLNEIATHWIDESSSEVGFEISYKLTSESEWTVYDTSAINAQFMDLTIAVADTYNVRIRTIGNYANSDYSPTWTTVVSCDQTPTAFAFTDITDAEPSILSILLYQSDSIVVAGLGCDTRLSISGGGYKIGVYGNIVYDVIDVSNGDTIWVSVASSENYSTTTSCILAIGSVRDTFSVTTADEVILDTTPPAAPTNLNAYNIDHPIGGGGSPVDTIPIFTPTSFTNVTNAHLDSLHISNGMALSSFDSCWVYTPDSIRVGALGVYQTGWLKVFENDTIFAVKHSSGSYSTAVTCSLTVAGVLKRFTITTMVNPSSGWSGNIIYVDRDATGENDGTSWTDAYIGFSSINLSLLEAGDSIYVSGGTDSTVYRSGNTFVKMTSPFYSFSTPVVIAPAWHAGHNGDVQISPLAANTQWAFVTMGISNIKFTGLKFIDDRTSISAPATGLIYCGGGDQETYSGDIDSLQVFDNCTIIGNGLCNMVYFAGYKQSMLNSYVEQVYSESANEQDPFGFSAGRGGYTIDGNTIIYSPGLTETDAHRDMLQFSNFGHASIDETVRIQISNNLLIHPYASPSWTGMIYSSNPNVNTNWYVYNNIIVTKNNLSAVGMIILNQPDSTWTQSVYILNNTIVQKGDPTGLSLPIVSYGQYPAHNLDTLVVLNNIVYVDSLVDNHISIHIMFPGTYHREFNYNAYYEYGDISDPFMPGEGFGSYSLATWLGDGWDANSITGNSTSVTFVEKYGTDIADYFTTAGRGLGSDLSARFPFLETDILGNSRSGSWDIGALFYIAP